MRLKLGVLVKTGEWKVYFWRQSKRKCKIVISFSYAHTHHITSHHTAILTTSSRPTMDGFPTFPGFSSSSARWLGVHLFLGLSLSCSPLGSLSSLLTLWRDPQWPLLLLLVSELSPRFSLLLPHPCRQLERSLFWGSVRSLSQKANIDAIWGRSF